MTPSRKMSRRKKKLLRTIIVCGSINIILILTLLISGISRIAQTSSADEAGTPESVPEHDIVVENGVTYIDGIVIANKTYGLPPDYGDGLTSETWAAFEEMRDAAAADGESLEIVSGFRSYQTQRDLFEGYCASDGIEEAERYSARPGHSEHQTGEAMDINWISKKFADTSACKWLQDNAYKYGFILRYPEDKEEITGYIWEPWHYRYVGPELAAELYHGGDWITVEEYFGITSVYEGEYDWGE